MKYSPYFLLDHVVTGTKGLKNTYLLVKKTQIIKKYFYFHSKARDSGY